MTGSHWVIFHWHETELDPLGFVPNLQAAQCKEAQVSSTLGPTPPHPTWPSSGHHYLNTNICV